MLEVQTLMGIIKILGEHVVAKIAAGEVVERPVSVVKELIDNSIDAGADSIVIDVTGGGKKSIHITDNGCGMDAEDARRCVERHATSKISSEIDLTNLKTMGFRGEALGAIASISKLKIETKTSGRNTIEGTFVNVEGGIVREIRATGCPPGTSVRVSDLFFNVPARMKFLKSDSVEYGHIADVVSSMALAHSRVRFELSNEGVSRLRYHRTGDIKNRITDVLGEEIGRGLFEFSERGEGIEVNGFTVKSAVARSTPRDMYFFVNGRPVKDRILQHAVLSGFETFLTKGAYPIAVLYLKVDPAIVDVNVHPTKREVRFVNSGMIHDFVQAAVRKAVQCSDSSLVACHSFAGNERVVLPPPAPPYKGGEIELATSELPSQSKIVESPRLRIIGQFDKAFILCEGVGGKLVIIDQHAAHERLGFEELKRQLARGSVEQQRLLLPEHLKLSSREMSVLLEYLPQIECAGFEVEPFGGVSIVVKAIPSLLGDISIKSFFEKIASELSDFGASSATNEAQNKILSVIACHRQVRAGDALTKDEMEALVHDIERMGASHCPHGRPAIVTIERSEVYKWFKRV